MPAAAAAAAATDAASGRARARDRAAPEGAPARGPLAGLYRLVSEVVDEVAIVLSGLNRPRQSFARTEDPPPLHDELIAEMEGAPPRIRWPRGSERGAASAARVPVDLPALGLSTFLDLHPARGGRADTLLVYHHGLSEIPHDALARAVYRARPLAERCDLIVMKAPHHESPSAVSDRFLACRTRFARYLAGQVATAKQVARDLGHRYRFLALSGVSMGGIISLGESAYDPHYDLTVPIVAGPCLYDVLLESSFRRSVARSFLRAERDAPWKDVLDLDRRLAASEDGPPIRALLARSDKLFRLERQLAGYAGCARARVSVFEGGHITGAMNVPRLARHLVGALRETCWDAGRAGWRERAGALSAFEGDGVAAGAGLPRARLVVA